MESNLIIFLVTALFLAAIVGVMFYRGRNHTKKKKITKMQHLRKLRLKQGRRKKVISR